MDRPVCTREVTINLPDGLHMRPALQLAQLAQSFGCNVVIHKADRAANAKNLVELMTLAAEQGTKLVLEAEGDGSAEAVDLLAKLFETNFKVEEPPAA